MAHILHATDLHYRRRLFDWLLKEARNVDVVVVSGDLIDALPTSRTNLADQVQWVSDWCLSLPCPLVMCSGNHDVEPMLDGAEPAEPDAGWLVKLRRPGKVLVDGDDTILHGLRFISRPWLGGSWPRPGSTPVMLVTHDGPAGSDVVGLDLGASGDPEVADIASSLSPLSWVLSGHLHSPGRWHGRVGHAHCSNPGVGPWSASKPNTVLINSDRRTATFRGWDGEVDLVRY